MARYRHVKTLWPKEKHRLNHHQVKPPRGSCFIHLLVKHTVEPSPFILIYLVVPVHHGPVDIAKGNNPDQILKYVHLFKDLVPWPELRPSCYLVNSGVYMVVLSLRPPLAHYGDLVSCRHQILGYKHITLLAPMVGVGALFEDYNGFPQLPVHGMQPEVGAPGWPPWTALNRAFDGFGNLWEDHPVFLWSKYIQWLW